MMNTMFKLLYDYVDSIGGGDKVYLYKVNHRDRAAGLVGNDGTILTDQVINEGTIRIKGNIVYYTDTDRIVNIQLVYKDKSGNTKLRSLAKLDSDTYYVDGILSKVVVVANKHGGKLLIPKAKSKGQSKEYRNIIDCRPLKCLIGVYWMKVNPETHCVEKSRVDLLNYDSTIIKSNIIWGEEMEEETGIEVKYILSRNVALIDYVDRKNRDKVYGDTFYN